MPESKTIEIDEIVTPEKSGENDPSARSATASGSAAASDPNPFADFHKALPWKARLTLRLTQWFMLLRSKSWGNWVIVPAVVLALLLVIPLGALFFCILVLRSLLRSFTRP